MLLEEIDFDMDREEGCSCLKVLNMGVISKSEINYRPWNMNLYSDIKPENNPFSK